MHRVVYQMALGSTGLLSKLLSIRKPTIFCFHSVTDTASSGFSSRSAMAVSSTYLERLVLDLRVQGIPIVSLSDAVTRTRNGDTEPFLVLTFDDGYRDNYENLFPLMVRLQTPFTVFVTTGLVDRTIPMWWESLERMAIPDGAAARGKTAPRSDAFSVDELTERFRSLDPSGQCALLSAMARTSGGIVEKDAYERSLTWPMLREMAATGLLTVGSHTQHHPMLSRLSRDEVRSELAGSRQRLEQELDVPVDYIAYPYGQPWEVGPFAEDVAQELGFLAAFSTIARPLAKGDDTEMFNLPRILLSNKAQSSNIALGYMSGLPAVVKRMAKRATVSLQ